MQGLRAHACANAHSGLRGPRSPARGPERSRPSTVLHPTTPLCPTQCLGAPSLLLDAPLPAGPPSIQGRGSNPLSLPTVRRSTLILQGRLHQGQVEPEASRSLRPPVPAGPDAALLAFRLPPRPHTLPGRPASERTLNPACHADSSHLPGRSRHRSRRGHRPRRSRHLCFRCALPHLPPPPTPPLSPSHVSCVGPMGEPLGRDSESSRANRRARTRPCRRWAGPRATSRGVLTRVGKSWRTVPGEQGASCHARSGPHALGAGARRATLDSHVYMSLRLCPQTPSLECARL